MILKKIKATCLEGPKKLAENNPSTGYQNGITCKCASWTSSVPSGPCENNEQEFTRTCDKDDVIFANPVKNECDGEAISIGKCGKFEFGDWKWLYCSENCGPGVEIATRNCTAVGDAPCPAPGSCVEEAICVYKTRPCQLQKCLNCDNFENYCDNRINTQCIDVILENGETTVR